MSFWRVVKYVNVIHCNVCLIYFFRHTLVHISFYNYIYTCICSYKKIMEHVRLLHTNNAITTCNK